VRVPIVGVLLLFLTGVVTGASAQVPPAALDVYFVDVEGGQATLFVSPSGDSMLIDAGYAGFGGRDAERIVAVARLAGLKQIDYLLITHFHGDHVGGVPELAARFPIRTFVDAGTTIESEKSAQALFQNYAEVRKKGRHILATPGATIPLAGIEVRIVASAAELITAPLSGVPSAGSANPLCAKPFDADAPGARLRPSTLGQPWSENFQSVATHITYGNFRLVDLGDLNWDQERRFVCPTNLLGTADVYVATAHGQQISGPEVLVHALRPRAIVLNNAAKKGGDSPTMAVVRSSPGADVWQLHFSQLATRVENAPDEFIANLGDVDTGHWIKLSARPDGSFVVTNGRQNFTKRYGPPQSVETVH
jgi:beta-lactamase superfamily II metal-dependent hydrolase